MPRLAVLTCGLLSACGSGAIHAGTDSTSAQVSAFISPPATTPGRPSVAMCGPRNGRTLAASAVARIYVVNRAVYGCSVHGRKPFHLGRRPPCMSQCVGTVAIAGEFAAYALSENAVDTSYAEVVVRRLTDGQQLRRATATTKPLGPESYQSVDSLAVKADSAVAWIGVGGSIVRRGTDIEVRKADKRGQATLDSGPAIDSGSLRLDGSRLTWRNGRQVRSAMLV